VVLVVTLRLRLYWAAFHFSALSWPGLAPAGDPFLCVAKERGKERRPGFPGRSLRERLPCAARIGRPARLSEPAGRVPRRRSRPGVQTRPWKNPGQLDAEKWKAAQ